MSVVMHSNEDFLILVIVIDCSVESEINLDLKWKLFEMLDLLFDLMNLEHGANVLIACD